MPILWYCRQCEDLFESNRQMESFPITETKCPHCHSDEIIGLKIYPTERNCDGINPAPWEFVCFKCLIYFEIPSPSTPEQAQSVKCPICHSANIKQFNVCCVDNMDHTCFG